MALNRSALITIVCGALLLLLAFGFRSSLGLFVQPMSEAHGWGRDVLGLALAIQNLSWGVIAVIAGGLADRFGNVKVIVSGAVLYGMGLGFAAEAAGPLALHSSLGLLVGAGIAGTGFGIVLPLMAKAVDASRRQWVLGVGTAAGSFGQFILNPVAQLLIDGFGWAGALNIMALLTFSMVLLAMPLARVARAEQSQVAKSTPSGTAAADAGLWQTAGLASRHTSYWLLTTGFFVCGFHVAFITVHLPGYLTNKGFEASIAAWSIALIGLFNIFGSLAAGNLSGRFSMRRVLLFIYAARAITISLFLLVPLSVPSIMAFSCVMGALWLATVPPTTGLVAAMFGTRYLATLYGVVFLGHQLGSFSGVWLGGVIYESTGSYDAIWWAGVVLSVVAVGLHWPIRETQVSGAPQPA